MKALSYTWKIIVNIISVIVILTIFSVSSTKFESVVLSALVLIYLSICSFTALWGLHQVEFAEALNEEFIAVKRLLRKDAINQNEDFRINDLLNEIQTGKQEIDEDKKERTEKKKTLMIKFYINVGFQTLIYIITLFNLLKALNS